MQFYCFKPSTLTLSVYPLHVIVCLISFHLHINNFCPKISHTAHGKLHGLALTLFVSVIRLSRRAEALKVKGLIKEPVCEIENIMGKMREICKKEKQEDWT